jgi:hypothetical protein
VFNRSCVCFVVLPALAGLAFSATLYDAGLAPTCGTCVIGVHLVGADPHPSVAGVGGGGFNKPAGSALDGNRTYTYDLGAAAPIAAGTTSRGASDFAMLIWDMGTALNTMRLYTHQDHYSGGPITTQFVAQDVMEYSVWGSNDGDNFILLSDVVNYDINGGGAGLPTYTFTGTAPEVIFRGGSQEFGVLNAYTRDYVFPSSWRYYGVRASTVTLTMTGGAPDADPEIDAVFGNRGSIVNPTPEPSSLVLAGLGLAAAAVCRRRRHRASFC